MRRLSDRLAQIFKRIDGAMFKAIMSTVIDGAGNDDTFFRILRVRNPAFVKVGDIVHTYGNEHIILMSHPDDSENTSNFKVAYAEVVGPWLRMLKTTDLVTGVPKDGPWLTMGVLYLNFDSPKEIPMAALSDTRYRFITGQDVKVGDKIGTRVVKTIYDVLGVKLGFAE